MDTVRPKRSRQERRRGESGRSPVLCPPRRLPRHSRGSLRRPDGVLFYGMERHAAQRVQRYEPPTRQRTGVTPPITTYERCLSTDLAAHIRCEFKGSLHNLVEIDLIPDRKWCEFNPRPRTLPRTWPSDATTGEPENGRTPQPQRLRRHARRDSNPQPSDP